MLRNMEKSMHSKSMIRMFAIGAVFLAVPIAVQADTTVQGTLIGYQEVPAVSSNAAPPAASSSARRRARVARRSPRGG